MSESKKYKSVLGQKRKMSREKCREMEDDQTRDEMRGRELNQNTKTVVRDQLFLFFFSNFDIEGY
jgi:hypothetical protein